MSSEEKLRCVNCGGSGRVSAESELFAGVMGTTGCKACNGTGKDRLRELYAFTEQYLRKPVTEEQRKKYAAMREERLKNMDPVVALANVMEALKPQTDPDYVADTNKLWDRWSAEEDIHQRTLLQLELGAKVAGLLEHIEALEKQLPEPNPFRDEEGKPWT